jgi:hypothetical protein
MIPEDYAGAALVAMALTRSDCSAADTAAISDAFRRLAEVLMAAGPATLMRSFDVIPGATGPWTGGGVDVIYYRTIAELEAAALAAVEVRADLPALGPSLRLYGTRTWPVLTPGPEGVHLFAQGHFLPEFSREAGQARWKDHARLMVRTQWFAEQLLGYTQFDGLPAATAARLGLNDTNGIAHIATTSVDARLLSRTLPEYVDVLQPDERQFMAPGRGMRVFTVEATPIRDAATDT